MTPERSELERRLDETWRNRQALGRTVLPVYVSVIEEAASAQYDDVVAAACLRASDYLRAADNERKALTFARRALESATAASKPSLISRAHYSIGVILTYDDQQTALHHLEESLRIRRQLADDSQLLGNCLHAIGLLYSCMGRFLDAFQAYTECETLYRATGNALLLASVTECSGSSLLKMHRFDEALGAFRRALQLYREGNDTRGVLTSNLCIAVAYLGLRKADEALTVLENVRPLALDEDERYLRNIDLNIACALEQRGDAAEALRVVERVLQPSLADRLPQLTVSEVQLLSGLLADVGRIDEAAQWIEYGEGLLSANVQPRQTVEFLQTAARVMSVRGAHERAYHMLARATTLSTELLTEERRLIAIDTSSNKRSADIARLHAAFPRLGENECMACVLFASGLNTKDVARIMHLSVRSVESIRLRVSKKIGLHSTRDLDDVVRAVVMQ